ncbi:hypothetical protein C8J57DRAFT_1348630 [Mycena rebaudengoi]|nr:hypothetical protein C8J57DRAFT_1348630 [Mycena rebaudengoi]
MIHHIYYTLNVLCATNDPTEGYIFLCPWGDLYSESNDTLFRYPDKPVYYWSLDPFEAQRLTAEAAKGLGFPPVEVEMWAETCSWDETGVDPISQDIVFHLGYPLYELSPKRESPFAHGECNEFLDPADAVIADEGVTPNLEAENDHTSLPGFDSSEVSSIASPSTSPAMNRGLRYRGWPLTILAAKVSYLHSSSLGYAFFHNNTLIRLL